MSDTKTCSRCRRTLPTDAFTRDKNTSDGYAAYCAPCRSQYRATHKRTLADQLDAAATTAATALTAHARAGHGTDVEAVRAVTALRQAAERWRTRR